jgi:23S rRNA (cytidine1920-2'-O)/16S rRNA (cytidine1409-2'-O)-methyltransferase
VPKLRLDQLVVNRGLAASRERARALILAGQVTVAGVPATKAGSLVAESANVALRTPEHPWVGRGGVKLAHALDVFAIDPTNAVALDIGASTGGFTDVLLQRGARLVVALDVGHGQLDWRLRSDPRVLVREGINARRLQPDDLPEEARRVDLVTIDVSFISLKHILPVVPRLLAPEASVIALVKPQFEAGRSDVGKGGIVRDERVHARVVGDISDAADAVGLERIRVEPSPIAGTEGNREFLLWLRLRDRAAAPQEP